MCERGSLLFSQMLESDRLDPATEKCVLLFQPIKSCLQLSDNCLGLIGGDDQFNIDPFVEHLNTSSPPILCLTGSVPHRKHVFQDNESRIIHFVYLSWAQPSSQIVATSAEVSIEENALSGDH